MNSATAENFMRSAKAPTMRAGVMRAKVIWKQMKTNSGMTTPTEKVAVESQSGHALEEAACRGRRSIGADAAGEGEGVAVDHPDHASRCTTAKNTCVEHRGMFLVRTRPP